MESSADKRVVIVTGSTSGIGRGVAELLLSRGWKVVLNSLTDDGVGTAMAEENDDLIYVCGNIADPHDCQRVVDTAVATWGRIDGLVNNAGTTAFVAIDDVEGVTGDIWRQVLDVNVIGTWQMISAAMPHLKVAAPGRIVNIASIAALRPVGSSVPYSVSKAAVVQMTLLLAKYLGPDVIVNAVAPGLIETPWTQNEAFTAARQQVEEHAPLRRAGTPEDVAIACEFLLNTTYTTGECIPVDGGTRLVM